jgi:hypothetical protein
MSDNPQLQPETRVNQFASIEVTQHEVMPGKRYYTYKWLGDPSAPVVIDYRSDLDIKDLPWPLRLVDEDALWRGKTYIRTDVPFWWWTEVKRDYVNLWRWISIRLLWTAHVWGLAKIEPHTYPSWRDLKIFKRSKQKRANR